MKIGIQTWGSDGDILPFIALAEGLRTAGHEVSVVYTSIDNKDYASFGTGSGISFVKVYEKFDKPVEKILTDILYTRNPLKELALTLENCFNPAVEEMYAAARQLCRESDLVVGHVIHYPLAIAAETAGCPRVPVALCPLLIASKYASPWGPSFGRWLNSPMWRLADLLARKTIYQPAHGLRDKVGLPPYRNLQAQLYVSSLLTLIATCGPLCPRLPDWGENIQICGFLNPARMASDWVMPEGLRKFLEDGAPPVYFTFGSLTQFDIDRTTRLFLDAAELAGIRAIIQSDWDKFQTSGGVQDIFRVQSIPHDHIFPHCSMIVHHGGSGTTQSALQAGKPSLVIAHAFDQPYWGKKMHQIGVAPKLLHRRAATAGRIAKNIRMILNSPQMSHQAKKIGQDMRAEDGVANAVAAIEARFGQLVPKISE